MRGVEMRRLREALGKSVSELAADLGLNDQTIRAYEREMKYKDRQPVTIPRTVELACLALWAGLTNFETVFPSDHVTSKDAVLPERSVPDPIRESALRKLASRHIEVGPRRYFFEWERFLTLWPQIDAWCREDAERQGTKLHPVLKRDQPGGGVAVLEFPTDNVQFEFKMRWIGGV